MSFLDEKPKRDRTKFIGGSDIPIIMGLSPHKSPHQLYLEKVGDVEPKDISEEFHVKRGTDNEPVAIEKLEDETGLQFKNNVVFTIDGWKACEVDGHNPLVIAEVKCMGKQAHENAAKGIVPEHYQAQCQWNMYITQIDKCYFTSYRPEDGTLFIVPMKADKKRQEEILKAATDFWERVQTRNPPELTDLDFEDMSKDAHFKELCSVYTETKTQLDELESKLKLTKAALREAMGDRTRAKCGTMKLTQFERKGNVNYKKIPELQGVDLEPYRGKPTKVFTVKLK
jgi:putative phage-type endonuclease